MPAVPIIAAVAGGVIANQGAKKSAAAIDRANAANIAATQQANQLDYQRWRESQGIGPNGEAINYKTPRWLMANTGVGGPRKLTPRSQLSTVSPTAIRSATVKTMSPTTSNFAQATSDQDYLSNFG